jgi:hypothetical protein
MDLDLVGQQSEALVAFVLLVSIEDRPLHWTLVRSQTYYPKHILAYGSVKTCYSLVMGFGSFRTNRYGGLLDMRSKHHTKAGPSVLGAWSPSLDGDLDPLDRSGTGWSCLCLGYKRGVCFFGYPAGHIDSRIAVST